MTMYIACLIVLWAMKENITGSADSRVCECWGGKGWEGEDSLRR